MRVTYIVFHSIALTAVNDDLVYISRPVVALLSKHLNFIYFHRPGCHVCTATLATGLFHRVVADEGHMLKTISSRAHQAVALLDASKQWFLTATPMLVPETYIASNIENWSQTQTTEHPEYYNWKGPNRVIDLCGFLAIVYCADITPYYCNPGYHRAVPFPLSGFGLYRPWLRWSGGVRREQLESSITPTPILE